LKDKDNIKQAKTKTTKKPKNPNLTAKGKPREKLGRKTKYDTHVLPKFRLIEAWCRDGATDEVIYKKLQISKDSFYEYKKKYPEFSDLLKTSKEDTDVQVENALLKRALGFKEKVTKPMKIKVDRDSEKIVYVEEESYYPPDTTAQIFWLKNRKQDTWRNNDKIEITPESNEMLKSISVQINNKANEKKDDDIDMLDDGDNA